MSVAKLEKPDPGENYRLLKKSPDEALKPGDEFFVRAAKVWYRSDNAETGGVQEASAWYRRRIEPAQSEPNVLYPKIGDVIFLPEIGRLKVTARGFEIC